MQTPSKKTFRAILRFSPMVLGVLALIYSLTLHRSFSEGSPNSVEPNVVSVDQEDISTEADSGEMTSRDEFSEREIDFLPDEEEIAEAEAIIRADPLKSALRRALRNFQNLKTYQYDMTVIVYEGGEVVSEAALEGSVKDQKIVAATTSLDGETFEVLSRGGESYIKDEEGEWIPTAHQNYEAGEGSQNAFSFREELQDVALAHMPLYPGRTEIIDGEPCQAIQMKMSGATPDETGSTSTAATEITFVIDSNDNIRTWRMNSEVEEEGAMMNTIVESNFAKFNDPWRIPLPEEWN